MMIDMPILWGFCWSTLDEPWVLTPRDNKDAHKHETTQQMVMFAKKYCME
jgi:hypothetical protein